MANDKREWTFVYVTGKYVAEGWRLLIRTPEELMAYHEIVDTGRVADAFSNKKTHSKLGTAAEMRAQANGTSWVGGLASLMADALTKQLEYVQETPLIFNEGGGYCFLDKNTEVLKEITKDSLSFRDLPGEDFEDSKEKEVTYHLNEALGFVAPNGYYTHAKWGEHHIVAESIVEAKGWEQAFRQGEYPSAEDFLLYTKNYAIITAPDTKKIQVLRNGAGLTKRQRDTLYGKIVDYDKRLAETIFKEDMEYER